MGALDPGRAGVAMLPVEGYQRTLAHVPASETPNTALRFFLFWLSAEGWPVLRFCGGNTRSLK